MSNLHCAQLEAALPWYLNGTAAAADRARVDAHLADCADCRQRMAAEQRIVAHMRESDAIDAPDAEQAWQRFERTIGSNAAQPPGESRHLRWIVGAQAAALIVFGLAFWQLLIEQRQSAATYRTVATAAPAAAPGQVLLHLAVAPGTPTGRVAEIAREQGGAVISGPSAQGVYTLELTPTAMQHMAITRLRAVEGVLLVEPIASSATR